MFDLVRNMALILLIAFTVCLTIFNPVLGFIILHDNINLRSHLGEDISSFWCQKKNLQQHCSQYPDTQSCIGKYFKALFYTETKDEKIFDYDNYILGSLLPNVRCPVKFENAVELSKGQKAPFIPTENASEEILVKSSENGHAFKMDTTFAPTQNTSLPFPENKLDEKQIMPTSILETPSDNETSKMKPRVTKHEMASPEIGYNDGDPPVVSGTTHWCWMVFIIVLVCFGVVLFGGIDTQSGFLRSVNVTGTIHTPTVEQETYA